MSECKHNWHFVKETLITPGMYFEYRFVCDKCHKVKEVKENE